MSWCLYLYWCDQWQITASESRQIRSSQLAVAGSGTKERKGCKSLGGDSYVGQLQMSKPISWQLDLSLGIPCYEYSMSQSWLTWNCDEWYTIYKWYICTMCCLVLQCVSQPFFVVKWSLSSIYVLWSERSVLLIAVVVPACRPQCDTDGCIGHYISLMTIWWNNIFWYNMM